MAVETPDALELRNWIGRQDVSQDAVTPELLRRFQATLAYPGVSPPETLLGVHWCLSPTVVPPSQIGVDGHPERGAFLPPVSLPRRMWAGGELTFASPLQPGDHVQRTSVIRDIVRKNGRAGPLVILTVSHDYSTARGPVLHERQDIVYLAAPSQPQLSPPRQTPRKPDWQVSIPADPTLLFRYSALTFNGHRIHYDRPYAVEEEHYPGLVVHGPLQATLLLRLAATIHGMTPRKFAFRSTTPIFDGGSLTLNASRSDDGLSLWTADQSGCTAMTAQVQW